MKPGWKTSEFWFTMFTNIIGAVLASGLVHQETHLAQAMGAAMIVLANLGYTYNRAVVKSSASSNAPPPPAQ